MNAEIEQEQEQYYQDEKNKCEEFTEHSVVNSRLSVVYKELKQNNKEQNNICGMCGITGHYAIDYKELKQNNKEQNNICDMCGITGHYTIDCESDEIFKQQVLEGCWSFWYCACGSEFFEECELIEHVENCSCCK